VWEAKVVDNAKPTPTPEPVTRVPVFPVKCVVVPIDLSESAAAAVVTALELVSNPAGVHVLHAILPSSTFSPTGEWAPLREGEVVGTVSRNELAAYLEKHNVSGVTQAIEVGDPASVVAAYARKHQADLIVVPSHGYHGIKRMVMGSVAEQIIRHCECAVLVLHRYDSLVPSS
jgi:nucleotide-binding universal stress UspA family protein